MQLIVCNEEEMHELGKTMAKVLTSGTLVYLIGELGAGKTTLVRGIARGKGYEGKVTSPTFTLMNIYEAEIPIFHFDFYRLQSAELYDLGLDDYLEKEGVSLIEWPQVGIDHLPYEALVVNIELVEDDYDRERSVTISARGPKYYKKLEELAELC